MDINFELEKNKTFNQRVAGIIKNDNKILLCKKDGQDHWSLPGGRVKFNETSENALRRKILEELELPNIKNSKTLWISENFFEENDRSIHEIIIYYEVKLEDDDVLFDLESLELEEDNKLMIFKWFDLDKLENEDIKPEYLKNRLNNINDVIEHFIEKE